MEDFNRKLMEDLRANGGRASSGPFVGRHVLILTTTGARSQVRRETPLVYSRDGDRLVIVASMGGAPRHPGWYHNLVAHPEVTIEVEGETRQVRAHTVDEEAEYERLYAQHAEPMPAFNEYRENTTRRIPVVLLEPAS
jgi:deazaflavin-dependent oxidoreductase (nitroreductase family)